MTIFEVLTEFVTISLLLHVWFFGPESCVVLARNQEIEPSAPTLEDEVLTTEPPG